MGRRKKDLLSKQDLDRLLELIHSSLSCADEDQLRILINDLMYLIPFDYALCGFGGMTHNSMESKSSYVLNVSYPTEWLEVYNRLNLERIDPVVMEHCLHFNIQYWADTNRLHDTPRSRLVMIRANDFGLKGGYTYGLPTYNRSGASIFSFAANSFKKNAHTEHVLERLIPHLHQVLSRISTPCLGETKGGHEVNLEPIEIEILKWVSGNKDLWEISSILSQSQEKIAAHIEDIFGKLESVNSGQAVATAIERGLVDFDLN